MKRSGKYLSLTTRLVFIVSLFFSMYVFAMFQGGTVSWTIFYMVTPFLLYSIALFLYPLSVLKVKRSIRSKTIEKGGKLHVTLHITRSFPFPLLYTTISEKWDDARVIESVPQTKQFFIFGFKKEIEWSYEVDKLPRGQYTIEGLEVEIADFFGWIQKRSFIEIKDSILVFPNTTSMHYVPIDAQYDRGSLLSPYSLVKDTTMATGVRDYQAGDRVTWIHWKSFARTQNLMTKEFEDRQSEDLVVLLDGRVSDTFEEQVELTASLIEEASRQQASIAFVSTGEEITVFPFIHSAEQLNEVFVHLAKIKPVSMNDMKLIARSTFSALAGSVIVVTGKPDAAFIQTVNHVTTSMKSVICFVVVDKLQAVSTELQQQVAYAKSKGIAVHLLSRKQFSDAFKEVSSF